MDRYVSAAKRRRRAPIGAAMMCAVAAMICSAQPAAAQYKQIKPKVADTAARALLAKAEAGIRAPAPTAADLKAIDDYFLGYFFPHMTSVNPDDLGSLANSRKMLQTRFIGAARSTQARDHLVGIIFRATAPISAGPYHPAVRYNATLMMGQLDASGAAAGAPSKPLPQATNALTMLLASDKIKEVPVPSSVKVAALVGLDRHTRLGIEGDLAPKITAAALAIATRSEPPEDLAPEANSWLRRLAARVLATQFAAGLTPPVHQALVSLIGGRELQLDDRTEVAKTLTATMYTGAEGVNVEEMADALGKLAKAVVAEERTKAEEYQEAVVGGNQGGFDGGRGRGGYGRGGRGDGGGRGGRGGFEGMPMGEQGPSYEKRRMLERTVAVITGASAIASSGSAELTQRLNALVTTMQQAVDVVADNRTTPLAVTDAVVKLAGDVNDMVGEWGAAAPAEDAPAGDDDEFAEAA